MTDSFALAEQAWFCNFLQAGSVVRKRDSGQLLLALGAVQQLAHVAWPLEEVGSREGGVGVKSAQRVEASAVRRIGSVEGLQVEKTWASSVLMVRVCEQEGGRAR